MHDRREENGEREGASVALGGTRTHEDLPASDRPSGHERHTVSGSHEHGHILLKFAEGQDAFERDRWP